MGSLNLWNNEELKLLQDVEHDLDDMLASVRQSLINVIAFGARKHGPGSWKDPHNPSMEHKANHASLFRHLSESYCEHTEDADTGEHPLAHVIVRSLMKLRRDYNDVQRAE